MEVHGIRSSLRMGTARTRILDAVILVVDERGYGQTSVTAVCARAGVARGTFYEVFDGLQDCFLVMMDDAIVRTRGLIEQAFSEHTHWQDGLRAALVAMLNFFDAHPRLARVWLVETLAAGSWALQHRERHIAALTETIMERWPLGEQRMSDSLSAAGAMESVLALIRVRLLNEAREPTIGLLVPMMSLITTIYLGPREAMIEAERSAALVGEMLVAGGGTTATERPQVEVPDALGHPRAHRLRACLRHLAEHPGASNRQIAAMVGIARDDQISTALARLAAMGLLVKSASRPGGPNAWSLSALGRQVAEALRSADEA